MASTQQLKQRIGSVKNTKQITKAMELVSASKMRRAQDNANLSRDYTTLARAILTRIGELTDVTVHPLYAPRPVKTRLMIVIASDRGLAGAYNSNVMRFFARELQNDVENNVVSRAIVVGKQVARFASRIEDCDVIAAYDNFPEKPSANDIQPILSTIIEQYTSGQIDRVDIVFTDFISSIRQEVTQQRVLPASAAHDKISDDLENAVFEPSVKKVLDSVTDQLLEAQLMQAFLEAFASEHSMRMMAMKNATDNANDIIDDLTLAFNTARQAAITQEIAEITGGAEAIK